MTGVDGKRVLDGRPATLKQTCVESLQRLGTEVIDLYYLHRLDKRVPIEDSVGALADLVRRASAIHPIAAVQSEYSLWTRNPEIALIDECRRLGVALVAFSPIARGFLAGSVPEAEHLQPRDIRRDMPRFKSPAYAANRRLL